MTSAEPWRVMIVEDDPAVVTLHRKIVARVPGFEVVAAAASGQDTINEIKRTRPDLLLLDLTLRGTDGVQVLRRLRANGSAVEVIAVTASRDAATVRAVVQLGVVEYLVKPFTPERLQQSLVLFRERMRALSQEVLDQHGVDQVSSAGRPGRRLVPKGLDPALLNRVRAVLADSERPVSAVDVADQTGMARVTIRRYLEYLVVTQQATVEAVPTGPGRPRKLYRAAL